MGARKRLKPRRNGALLGHRELAVRTDGIVYTSPDSESFLRWSAFTEVIDAPEHVLLIVDTAAGLLIPKRASSAERVAAAIANTAAAGTIQERTLNERRRLERVPENAVGRWTATRSLLRLRRLSNQPGPYGQASST